MKIWKSFSGEHSAKLRIIGKFKTEEDAKKASEVFNRLLDVQPRYPHNKDDFYSDEMMKFFRETNFIVPAEDMQFLDYLYPVRADGKIIQVDTDDWALHPLM